MATLNVIPTEAEGSVLAGPVSAHVNWDSEEKLPELDWGSAGFSQLSTPNSQLK